MTVSWEARGDEFVSLLRTQMRFSIRHEEVEELWLSSRLLGTLQPQCSSFRTKASYSIWRFALIQIDRVSRMARYLGCTVASVVDLNESDSQRDAGRDAKSAGCESPVGAPVHPHVTAIGRVSCQGWTRHRRNLTKEHL